MSKNKIYNKSNSSHTQVTHKLYSKRVKKSNQKYKIIYSKAIDNNLKKQVDKAKNRRNLLLYNLDFLLLIILFLNLIINIVLMCLNINSMLNLKVLCMNLTALLTLMIKLPR